jgi:hypothetical protein
MWLRSNLDDGGVLSYSVDPVGVDFALFVATNSTTRVNKYGTVTVMCSTAMTAVDLIVVTVIA